MKTLRVATYNIHKGTMGLGIHRRNSLYALSQGIREIDCDLIFLQEVQLHHTAHARRFNDWPQIPQHEFLAQHARNSAPNATPYYTAYHTNAFTRHGEHGNALISRLPIVSIGHQDISHHRFEQRGLLHVVVQWGKQHLHCIVIHFGLIAASRIRQSQQLMRYVQTHVPADCPLIIAGDSNDWGQRICQQFVQADLIAVKNQGRLPLTYPARLPMLPLDRIYLRGLAHQETHVLHGAQWALRSDHAPLLTHVSSHSINSTVNCAS